MKTIFGTTKDKLKTAASDCVNTAVEFDKCMEQCKNPEPSKHDSVTLEIREGNIDDVLKFTSNLTQMPEKPTLEQITTLAESYQLATSFDKFIQYISGVKTMKGENDAFHTFENSGVCTMTYNFVTVRNRSSY